MQEKSPARVSRAVISGQSVQLEKIHQDRQDLKNDHSDQRLSGEAVSAAFSSQKDDHGQREKYSENADGKHR